MAAYDALLVEVRRAVEASTLISPEQVLAALEKRFQGANGASYRLFAAIEGPVREAFPDRGGAILSEVAGLLWPGGVAGLATVSVAPEGKGADPEREDIPSCVVVGESMDRGLRLFLTRPAMVLGRAGGHSLAFQLRDPNLGRSHLEFRLEEDGVRLVDLESASGTFVDEQRIAAGGVLLADGARIRAGQTQLVYRAARAMQPARPEVVRAHELICEAASAIANRWWDTRRADHGDDFDDFGHYKGNSRWAESAAANIRAVEIETLQSVEELCAACLQAAEQSQGDSDYAPPTMAREQVRAAIEKILTPPPEKPEEPEEKKRPEGLLGAIRRMMGLR